MEREGCARAAALDGDHGTDRLDQTRNSACP
jgi:hypothetical protein